MGLIDLILNLVALLLWLNWRSARFDPLIKASPATLVGTLKRAEPKRLKGWPYLLSLLVLLLARALIYQQAGTAAAWTPRLNLGPVVLAFRNDAFRSVLLYSVLSFGRLLVLVYIWVLSLGALNRGVVEADPLQKLLRVHLGRVMRWSWALQIALPLALITGLWVGLHPVLLHLGLTTPVTSEGHLVEQGILIAVEAACTLKFLLPVILLLHLVVSYVYLGSSPFWDFITHTSQSLLRPLRWLPLQLGKLDLTPLVGVILVLSLLHILPGYLLPKLPWPQ